MNGILILGNQLFDPKRLSEDMGGAARVFMREDVELCTYYRFHQQKIAFFLAAMRTYSDELRAAGFKVDYQILEASGGTYEAALAAWIKARKITKLFVYEIEDKFFETRIAELAKRSGAVLQVLRSPMFLTSREEFQGYMRGRKAPFMKTFYESQRKRLKVLVSKEGEPAGGAWSLDKENRLALPAALDPPSIVPRGLKTSAHVTDVISLCHERFDSHPGRAAELWLPVDRAGAYAWLELFLKERLADFGPYEDAISPRSDFVFHSVLTPFLNTGLLTPEEVIRATLAHAKKAKIPLNSLEGFIRQVIGWREFIRGIYRGYSERQETSNFWSHRKTLKPCWYDGTTGVPPLDNAIRKTVKYAYAHHIERLMVIGNLMLLLEVEPREAHRWFMEMFIDSSDWVMGPNVYGMALFSDGGIFATKPYICGSNYYRKMGGYKKGDWCDGVDGLYWSFVERHKTFFLKNPRLSMMARSVEKMDSDKKKTLFAAADRLREKLVK